MMIVIAMEGKPPASMLVIYHREHAHASWMTSLADTEGNDIDVYLRPLIDELKELWEAGLDTYDSSRNEMFNLHAGLLWTISDCPGLAMLSGWSSKRKLAYRCLFL